MKKQTAFLVRRLLAARMPVILVALIISVTLMTDGQFVQFANIVNVLRQVSFEATIAFGMTAIIITGGIDLSVGSLVALTGVAAALVMRATGDFSPGLAIALGGLTAVVLGGGVGAMSGVVVAWCAIPPFIVTLAAMLIARGAALLLCNGQPVDGLPEQVLFLGRGFVFEDVIGKSLPFPVLIMLIVYALFAFTLNRTVFGRDVVAVGSNEEAARLSGISVRRAKLLVYVLTGAVCGLVGLLHDGKLNVGDPKVAEMWELNVIAAVVVGGTSLFGGRGTMTGTLIGALIIGVLNNALNLMHVEHFWQKVVLGAVILTAALADAGLRTLERKTE